ncbi:MAG TPA: endonuclease/exonuclease/phosphatase family protein, partial [Mycobacteriales bacterium]|nr:endonuclease/exonuclease/phosphatase family protein [Mycobacteriales bacterium]
TLVVVGLGVVGGVGGTTVTRTAAARTSPSLPAPTQATLGPPTASASRATDAPTPGPRDSRTRLAKERRKAARAAATARRHREQKPAPTPPPTTTFRISSFNLLGASHTAPGGNKHGWAPAARRMRGAVAKLTQHDVSVAGLQEFQVPQYHALRALTGGRYGVYPGASAGRAAVQNSIIWRTSDWQLAQAGTVPIPYFHGRRVPMPYVLLTNRHTGQAVWFANFHNPADVRGPAQRFRDVATSMETALFRRLGAGGTPVLVTGDMNERGDYACRLTAGVAMHSANGAYRDGSGCHLPARMNVDWIFGSPAVSFLSFVADRDAVVRRTTDHPMVVATAEIHPG